MQSKIKYFYLLAIITGIVGCTAKGNNTEEKKETEKYTVTNPVIIPEKYNKEYIAQIQSIKNIELHAMEKGYLTKIYVDEGQNVKTGQALFQIMPTMLEAEVLKHKAEAKEAQVDLSNSSLLASKNIVSKSEVTMKQAHLDAINADIKLAQTRLELTTIRAPFSGVLDRIKLKLGSLINEGDLLTTLSDNSSVYVYFNLPEKEYLAYKARTTNVKNYKESVNLILADGTLHPNTGVIETIEGQFDNETGNIAVRAKFLNPNGILKHGETGKIQMQNNIPNALVIPQKASFELQDKKYVFVVDKNNIAHMREITIEHELPNIYIISNGIETTDRILVDGLQIVKDGDKVGCKYQDPNYIINNLQLLN